MEYILLMLIILNSSCFFSNIFNKKIEQTLFFSIFSYILILFAFGIIGILKIGFISIMVLNFLAFIYNVYYGLKNKDKINKNFFTIGLILFLISYCFIVWQSLGRLATAWDEFSHWALVVKNMYGLDNLGIGTDSTVMIKDYLSGTSLFQYFCIKLCGEYKESMLYVGMDLIIVSLILPIFSKFDKKNNFIGFILYFVLLFLPTFFYPTIFSSLYVDAVLGLTFAYSLYSYFSNRKKDLCSFDVINLMISYAMLIFIKDFGIVLLLISFSIVLIDNIFVRNKFDYKKILKQNYLILVTPIPALVIKYMWGIVLRINGVISDGSTSNIFHTLKNVLSFHLVDYQLETTGNFIRASFTNNLTATLIPITYIIALLIVIIIGYYVLQNTKKNDSSTIKLLITFVVLGGIGYAGLLCLAYISFFSEYEAVRLASFNRYMSTYALGAIYVAIAIYVNFAQNNKSLGNFAIILFGLFVINFNFSTLLNMTVFARSTVNAADLGRLEYKIFDDKMDKYLDENDYTYFVSTNDNGIDYYIARYELTPNKMSNLEWSIGLPYSDEDIWTVYKSTDEWRDELLDEYDYVYLYDIDEEFIDLYHTLFLDGNIADNQLYKVVDTGAYSVLEFVE